MTNHTGVKPTGYLPHLVEQAREGYIDGALGLPFDPEHETWDRVHQLNYEMGRLLAAEAKAANALINPDTWRNAGVIPQPLRPYLSAVTRDFGAYL